MADDALIADALVKRYGPTEALGGLSLSVPRGAFCGLFGRNGSGKTTTLNVVTGLTPRDGGEVTILDERLRFEPTAPTKARLAYVAAHLQLYWWMTCREHIDFVARFYPTWDRTRERELLQMLHIPLDQRVRTLSVGQYVQLQLLMALAHRPELLLIDEPGNLDAVVRQRLMESLIAAIAEEEMTVVMASHLIAELDGVCDYLCVIDAGRTLIQGSTEAMANAVKRVHYVGVPPQPPGYEHGLPPEQWEGAALRLFPNGSELQALIIGYTPRRAEGLRAHLGAESYEVEHLTLQEFFVALTED